jgi:hypothetical protein
VIAEAKQKISGWCKFDYQPVVVTREGNQDVYFIGDTGNTGDVTFGRHFKVVGNSVTTSTKSCFVIPGSPSEAKASGVWTTHLLSDSPTEFHVFLALKYKTTVFVNTATGAWSVDGAHIQKLR